MRNSVLAAAFVVASAAVGSAADLGTRCNSYRDMHEATPYGSLFFNVGAIRNRQNRELKRFAQITENGPVKLPSQGGYCFVFNHYDSPSGNDVKHIYRATITKTFSDGRTTEEPFEGKFTPTSRIISPDLPDLCISGTNGVVEIAIAFSSSDGTHFDWNISFSLK